MFGTWMARVLCHLCFSFAFFSFVSGFRRFFPVFTGSLAAVGAFASGGRLRRVAFGLRRGTFGLRRWAFGLRWGSFGLRRGTFGLRRGTFGLRWLTDVQLVVFTWGANCHLFDPHSFPLVILRCSATLDNKSGS